MQVFIVYAWIFSYLLFKKSHGCNNQGPDTSARFYTLIPGEEISIKGKVVIETFGHFLTASFDQRFLKQFFSLVWSHVEKNSPSQIHMKQILKEFKANIKRRY